MRSGKWKKGLRHAFVSQSAITLPEAAVGATPLCGPLTRHMGLLGGVPSAHSRRILRTTGDARRRIGARVGAGAASVAVPVTTARRGGRVRW